MGGGNFRQGPQFHNFFRGFLQMSVPVVVDRAFGGQEEVEARVPAEQEIEDWDKHRSLSEETVDPVQEEQDSPGRICALKCP
jgi:hypothetical protein